MLLVRDHQMSSKASSALQGDRSRTHMLAAFVLFRWKEKYIGQIGNRPGLPALQLISYVTLYMSVLSSDLYITIAATLDFDSFTDLSFFLGSEPLQK